VDNSLENPLTGPHKKGVFTRLICFARNPPAALRGGFFRSVISRCAIAHRGLTNAQPEPGNTIMTFPIVKFIDRAPQAVLP
jgi:hypothetical protein